MCLLQIYSLFLSFTTCLGFILVEETYWGSYSTFPQTLPPTMSARSETGNSFHTDVHQGTLKSLILQGLGLIWNTLSMNSCLRQEYNDTPYSPCENHQSHPGLLPEMHFEISNIICFWVSFQCKTQSKCSENQGKK